MQCNIDAKGKAVRLIYGLLMLGIAAAVAVLLIINVLTAWWVWLIVVGLALLGAFGIYEARAGWCAVRAMGIRTKY